MEDIITCCLCLNLYDPRDRIPKALPCQHTFCAPCLDQLEDTVVAADRDLRCPKCQSQFAMPDSGANALVTNFAVQDMIALNLHMTCNRGSLEEVPQQKSAEVQEEKTVEKAKIESSQESRNDSDETITCKAHPGKRVIMVCTTCDAALCAEDMKLIMKSSHKNHELEDIDAYLANIESVLGEVSASAQKLPQKVDAFCQASLERVDSLHTQMDKEIKAKALEAMEMIQTWQRTQHFTNDLLHSVNKGNIEESKLWKAEAKSIMKSVSKMSLAPQREKLSSMTTLKNLTSQVAALNEKCVKENVRPLFQPTIKPLSIQAD